MLPLLLGHRGARASRQIPENTMASFELCLEHGCDGFEFDVRCSKDGCAVICHDPVIAGLEIEQTPANDLNLPTLVQVLQRFPSQAFLDIELKVAGLETQILAALRTYPPQRGYVVSSFLPPVLSALNALDPAIPLGFLYDRPNQLPPPGLPLTWVIPHSKLLDQKLVDEVHASKRKIMVWTVNDVVAMRTLASWGVDAIISDETELLVRSIR
jgi:glycerophosphoryl diester phosphodiesterase